MEAVIARARTDLESLREELDRIAADVRGAAGVAEERVAQAARIAEAGEHPRPERGRSRSGT